MLGDCFLPVVLGLWNVISAKIDAHLWTISTRRTAVEEHGFNTEGGGGEGSFNTMERAVSIRRAMVGRAVMVGRFQYEGNSVEDSGIEPGNEAICFYARYM